MNNADAILSTFKVDEKSAFRMLYNTYFEPLALFADRIVNDAEAAEDIVQECFIDFWAHRRFLQLENGLDKYIYQSVKLSALTYYNRQQRKWDIYEKASKDIPTTELPPDSRSDEIEAIYHAINCLPEERRKIFLMICVDGMKYQEVADALKISINTVKTQMSRAIKSLREKLDDHTFTALLVIFF